MIGMIYVLPEYLFELFLRVLLRKTKIYRHVSRVSVSLSYKIMLFANTVEL